ncbi:MAG: hypothetical protein GY799_33740 [Desulfobulbaceae bacterium]|nr:hypothetical protein [Desulfobulbaceae bacterium]
MFFKRDSSKFDNQCLMETMDTPSNRRSNSTTLVDFRKKPRYDTQLPGEAISEKGDRAYILITNVSQSGLRVEGSGQRLVSLLPDINQDGPHTPATLQVCFSVPGPPDQSSDISVQCQTVYVIREELYSYKIGMKFTAFDDGNDVLEKYISSGASTR